MKQELDFGAPEPFCLVPEETEDGDARERAARQRQLDCEAAEKQQRELIESN